MILAARPSGPSLVALLLAAVATLACACGKPEADKRLIYGSSRDIESFFKQAHVQAKMADCENVRVNSQVTRGYSCTTTLNSENVRLLIARFELAKDQPDPDVGTEGRCERRPGFGSQLANIETYRAHWTCATQDQPFAYLEVRLAPNGDSCIEVFPLACPK